MEQEYIYGVARIRALEGSLFTDETINQLVQCKDYDEAMDFLRTKGWGNGNPDQSLEEMLEQERRRTWKVLDELIEDKEQCEILTIANEYHNLKAAIKQVCTELETENVFYEDTKTDTEFLKNCIRQGNYNLLPKGMEQAAKDATTVLMQTGDGQLCDVIIDRATLEAIKQAGQEATNEMIKKYADDLVTISDIKIAVRCAATNKDASFVSKALVSCDGVSVTELIIACKDGLDGVCSYLEKIGYSQAVSALKISKSVFECWCDNKIVEDIKSQKYDSIFMHFYNFTNKMLVANPNHVKHIGITHSLCYYKRSCYFLNYTLAILHVLFLPKYNIRTNSLLYTILNAFYSVSRVSFYTRNKNNCRNHLLSVFFYLC